MMLNSFDPKVFKISTTLKLQVGSGEIHYKMIKIELDYENDEDPRGFWSWSMIALSSKFHMLET